MRPDLLKGPVWEDLIWALAVMPLGGLVGFWVGGFVQIFRPVKMSDFVLYGSGLLGTFVVWIIVWSRTT